MNSSSTPGPYAAQPEIVVYWRPGCGFCSSLMSRLERAAVPHRLVNIWDDPDAAAEVRRIANGNETVPTVVVGTVGLVNPNLDAIIEVAKTEAPNAIPEDYEPPQMGRVGSMVNRILGGSA